MIGAALTSATNRNSEAVIEAAFGIGEVAAEVALASIDEDVGRELRVLRANAPGPDASVTFAICPNGIDAPLGSGTSTSRAIACGSDRMSRRWRTDTPYRSRPSTVVVTVSTPSADDTTGKLAPIRLDIEIVAADDALGESARSAGYRLEGQIDLPRERLDDVQIPPA